MASRATWKEVTSGTPSFRILAVMHISERPPGEVASTMVAGATPLSQASTRPMRTDRPRVKAAVTTMPMISRRDSVRRLGLKREPSEQPMKSCAALIRTGGIAELLSPERVSSRLTVSGPSSQALGIPARLNRQAATMASKASASSPGRTIWVVAGA